MTDNDGHNDEIVEERPVSFPASLWRRFFSPNFDEEIYAAREQLAETKSRKSAWDKSCIGKPFSENRISDLKRFIRRARLKIAALETEFLETEEHDRFSKQETIKQILASVEENEVKLTELEKRFRDDHVSSIDIAKLKAELNKKIRQKNAISTVCRAWIWWFLGTGFSFLALTTAVLIVLEGFKISDATLYLVALSFPVLFLCTNVLVLLIGYQPVPENKEWQISWQGKNLTTWEAGFHIKFPLYMTVDQRVYMGEQKVTLYMDEANRGGKISAKVDFSNSSAEVMAELFFTIFDSYTVVYDIKRVVEAISDKMEAGFRAYFGPKKIDDAIKERGDIDLRQIIIQDATAAAEFKRWGIKIESVAVTDIKLPPEVEEQRLKKLIAEKEKEAAIITAEKERDVALINEEQAKTDARIALVNGEAEGNRLKEMAEVAGITVREAVQLEITLKKFKAYEKTGMLVVGDQDEGKGFAAIAGAIRDQKSENEERSDNHD